MKIVVIFESGESDGYGPGTAVVTKMFSNLIWVLVTQVVTAELGTLPCTNHTVTKLNRKLVN